MNGRAKVAKAAAGRLGATALVLLLAASPALAQVPPEIAARNRAIGQKIDPVGTAEYYGPLAEKPPYAEAKVARDIAYGPDPKNRLDVFQPTRRAAGPLPVVIFVSGGESTRTEHRPNAEGFYDNVMLWAVKHGMVGVNTDRRPWRGNPWDAGPRDIALMIGWVRDNIGRYGGDPERIFFLGHAYGATQLASYLAHPEFWVGPRGGLTGAALLSAPFNVAPAAPAGAQPANNPMLDPAHSDLPGLKALDLPLFLGSAEFDNDNTMATAEALRTALCETRCPGHAVFKDHQHISAMFSFNTADESVSGPVLEWIRSVR
jgi:triacylglycerol lipase